jgi:hypothetical protein
MCLIRAPKIPTTPERQAMQVPKDPYDRRTGLNARRRRGMWASVLTGPLGLGTAPNVTSDRLTTLYPSDTLGG